MIEMLENGSINEQEMWPGDEVNFQLNRYVNKQN